MTEDTAAALLKVHCKQLTKGHRTGKQGTLFCGNNGHLSLEISLIQRVLHQASALDLCAYGCRII